jgi:putative membrane protein
MTIRNWGFAAGLAAALALVGTAEAQSYGSGSQAGAQSETAAGAGSAGSAGQTEQKMDKDLKEKIQKIHASNKAEIELAQLGAQRAQSPEVKQYAETLHRDHQQLDEKLTAAAQAAGVELSGKDYEKKHERAMKDMGKLEKKSGQEFDREFMSHMVKDHEKDLKDVKSAARDAEKGNHTELASVLTQAETGMQGHKTEAERIRDSLEKGGAQAAQAPGTATGSTGEAAGSTGSQDTATGGAKGTSSDRVGERGGDTGQSRGDTAGQTGTMGGSTGTGVGSTGTDTGAQNTQDTPSGGAQGTSSDRVGERGGDTGQAPGTKGESTTK